MSDAKKSRTILVTGGGSGIGAAISEAFLKQGDQVIIAQRSSPSLFDNQKSAEYRHLDLNDLSAIEPFMQQLLEDYGQLDVLVNNAGVMTQGSASNASLQDWQTSLNVNLSAPFLLIQHAMPALIKVGGCIVNIGSIEGLAVNPNHAAYCASKAGLHGLTQSVAVDYGEQGVRCNAIAPGWIDTSFNEDYINAMPYPDLFREGLSAIHPTGTTGKPEHVAALAVWLASSEAAFITGQIWKVDGGRMSKLSAPSS